MFQVLRRVIEVAKQNPPLDRHSLFVAMKPGANKKEL